MKNKVALLTGASRGIGREIAIRLAAEGIHLSLVGRDGKALQETVSKLSPYGIKTLVLPVDLADAESPAKIVSRTIGYFGQLDIVINNAGFGINKSFEKHTLADWEGLMAVNARAPFFITQAALPYLRQSSSPVVINISSAVGRLGYPFQAAYTASKHALMGWTKALAREVQNDKIRIHVIAPGGVATEMIQKMRPDINRDELIQPSELADIVVFLLSFKGNAMIDEINVRRFTATPWQ